MTQFPIQRDVFIAAYRRKLDRLKAELEKVAKSANLDHKEEAEQALVEYQEAYNVLSVIENGSSPEHFSAFMVDITDFGVFGLTEIFLEHPVYTHGLAIREDG